MAAAAKPAPRMPAPLIATSGWQIKYMCRDCRATGNVPMVRGESREHTAARLGASHASQSPVAQQCKGAVLYRSIWRETANGREGRIL